jgi:hypothetical protein
MLPMAKISNGLCGRLFLGPHQRNSFVTCCGRSLYHPEKGENLKLYPRSEVQIDEQGRDGSYFSFKEG